MSQIFKILVHFPKAVLAIFTALTLFFAYYSTKLEIDASSQTLLLEHDKDLEIWREVSKRYESPNFLVIAYTPNDDLLSQNSLNKIRAISNEIRKFDFVDSVLDITSVPLLQNKENQQISDLISHIPTLDDNDTDIKMARREFETSPLYASNLVSSDLKTTAIMINLKPNLKYDEFLQKKEILSKKELNSTITNDEKIELIELNKEFKIYRDANRIKEHDDLAQIRAVVAKYKNDGLKESLFLGGMNLIADDMMNFVRNDIGTYGVLSCLLLLFCFWLFFRQLKFVLIALVICAYSALLASGLFGFLGFEVTVISSNYIALQLIITVSVCIHLIVSYREYLSKFPNFTQNQLVYAVLKDRAKPCFFAIFTTIVGFFSLILCDIKPVISLGIMMSVGIAISLITAFILFSSIILLTKKTPIERKFEEHFKFTEFCANLAINHRKAIYAVCVTSVCVGLFGISKLKVENSFIGYFKESTEIYGGMAVIDKELGGTVPLDVVIKFGNNSAQNSQISQSEDDEFDEFEAEFAENQNKAQYWFSSDKMRIINKTHDFLKEQEFIGNVGSLSTLLKIGKNLNDGKELDDFMLAVMYNELPENYRKMVLSPYINIEANEAHFAIRTVDSDKNLRRNEFLKNLNANLQNLLANDGVGVQVSGVMVLYNNMLQSLVSSQFGTLSFTLLVLFAIFIVIFRSLKFALMAIVVNLIPLSLGFGIMGLLGIPLDIMSITIAAISIGMGVDNSIHYIHRYKQEIASNSAQNAVLNSHKSIGYAMYYTSFAVILGFSVMSISNFWPTIYFGLLIDLVMALLLLGALIILPSLILTFGKKGLAN